MNRKQPDLPPAVTPVDKPGTITQTRKYKLITPLYGGGAETQKADPITVVRATEVRGHLRFWWRATRGGNADGDLHEMQRREQEIWGSPGGRDKPGPSKVLVTITTENEGVPDHPFEVVQHPNGGPQIRSRSASKAHAYAAFPLQPKQQDAHPGMETEAVRNGVGFTLKISFPKDYRKDVEAALWAWETFGGIGARTRRGFGVPLCLEIDGAPFSKPSSQTVRQTLPEGLQKFVVKNGVWHPGVPHLSLEPNHYKLTAIKNDSDIAWRHLINSLKGFRQHRRDGNNHNHPGRSNWPEPEAIRIRTGQRHDDHQPLPLITEKFPRAQFGLPIIFHFKDMNHHNPDNPHFDPCDTTLEGKEHDRLASPLILRPIACSDGAVGLAAILEWEPMPGDAPYTPPGGLALKSSKNEYSVQSDLTAAEAGDIEPLNLGGQPQPDVLQAFLDFLN